METQINHVKLYLLSGNKITPMMAFEMWECIRLAAIIYTLRKRGMNIKMKFMKNKHNNGQHSIYWFEK